MRFPSCPNCLSRNTSPSPQHASIYGARATPDERRGVFSRFLTAHGIETNSQRSPSQAMSALSALAELGVHADRDGLHVMPPDQLAGAMSMQEECKEFLAKTKQFNDIVGDFIDVMESKSKVIEAEKLRAIGLANRVDHEKEVRKRKQLEVQTMINEKKAELERLTTQHESLMRVEMEQKALIEKVRALLRARATRHWRQTAFISPHSHLVAHAATCPPGPAANKQRSLAR